MRAWRRRLRAPSIRYEIGYSVPARDISLTKACSEVKRQAPMRTLLNIILTSNVRATLREIVRR